MGMEHTRRQAERRNRRVGAHGTYAAVLFRSRSAVEESRGTTIQARRPVARLVLVTLGVPARAAQNAFAASGCNPVIRFWNSIRLQRILGHDFVMMFDRPVHGREMCRDHRRDRADSLSQRREEPEGFPGLDDGLGRDAAGCWGHVACRHLHDARSTIVA